jgi:hypothetical protein
MRQAQLITYGLDDKAAARLQTLVNNRGVTLRVTRQRPACVNLLRQGAVGVLLLRVGKDLEAEFTLLADATELFPDVAVIVAGDIEHARLAGLAWDLGARGVFLPANDPSRVDDAILRMLPD